MFLAERTQFRRAIERKVPVSSWAPAPRPGSASESKGPPQREAPRLGLRNLEAPGPVSMYTCCPGLAEAVSTSSSLYGVPQMAQRHPIHRDSGDRRGGSLGPDSFYVFFNSVLASLAASPSLRASRLTPTLSPRFTVSVLSAVFLCTSLEKGPVDSFVPQVPGSRWAG